MANPQPTDAHLRMAHSINEQLMVSLFTEQQRRVLDLILRLSWGCGKKEAIIPNQKDFEIIGVGEGHIKGHLDWLEEAKVIIRAGNQYAFNKDFDAWRVSRALKFSRKHLTELVRLNLNGTYGKSKIDKKELTKSGSEILPKAEETTYGKGKIVMPSVASAKEKLNKRYINISPLPLLPDWLDKTTWESFLEMRKKKKASPTARGQELLIKNLEKLKSTGDDPNGVLNQSIMNNWTGVFPLKREGGSNGANRRHNQKRLPDREHGYTEPPPDPELDALVAANQRHS